MAGAKKCRESSLCRWGRNNSDIPEGPHLGAERLFDRSTALRHNEQMTPLGAMFRRLLSAAGQSHVAKTVEVYGWIILAEGIFILFLPQAVASLLQFGPLSEQSANFLRMVGLLVGGVGMLYVVSGRLNAEGFCFATLLDRPLVPPIVGVLWYLGLLPGGLALLFAVEDFGSFLWTLMAWRADLQRSKAR